MGCEDRDKEVTLAKGEGDVTEVMRALRETATMMVDGTINGVPIGHPMSLDLGIPDNVSDDDLDKLHAELMAEAKKAADLAVEVGAVGVRKAKAVQAKDMSSLVEASLDDAEIARRVAINNLVLSFLATILMKVDPVYRAAHEKVDELKRR